MTYIIYLGVDSKTGLRPDSDTISELVERHRTPTEGVLIKNTDEELEGGFRVFKTDDTLAGALKRFKGTELKNVEDLEREAKIIRKGAEATHDSTILKGVTPYKKMTEEEIKIEQKKQK